LSKLDNCIKDLCDKYTFEKVLSKQINLLYINVLRIYAINVYRIIYLDKFIDEYIYKCIFEGSSVILIDLYYNPLYYTVHLFIYIYLNKLNHNRFIQIDLSHKSLIHLYTIDLSSFDLHFFKSVFDLHFLKSVCESV
jgi:hypothetical protein